MGVTPSTSKIIQEVDLAYIVLEIENRETGAAFAGLEARNEHRRKELGERESVS